MFTLYISTNLGTGRSKNVNKITSNAFSTSVSLSVKMYHSVTWHRFWIYTAGGNETAQLEFFRCNYESGLIFEALASCHWKDHRIPMNSITKKVVLLFPVYSTARCIYFYVVSINFTYKEITLDENLYFVFYLYAILGLMYLYLHECRMSESNVIFELF